MRLSHMRPVRAAVFDDPNLVSCAGLVPVMALADQCGLAELSEQHLSVPTDKGANAGGKVNALVAGMVAGADCIDDMALLVTARWVRCSSARMRPRRWGRSFGSFASVMRANSMPWPPDCCAACTSALRCWPGSTARSWSTYLFSSRFLILELLKNVQQ